MVFRKILKHKTPIVSSLIAYFALSYWLQLQHNKLANVDFVLGWSLVVLAFFMSSYKLRKKISVLPLGKASSWHVLHIYGGFWCVALFVLHAGVSWPSSPINQALWLGSVIILISGIIGLLLTKFLTPKISVQGERLIYDRIPGHISLTREHSIQLILKAAKSPSGKPLVDYYNQNLIAIFSRCGHLGFKLFIHRKQLNKHIHELNAIQRYLDSENQKRLQRMKKLVIHKYILDWQYSTLAILRQWTLFHVPVIWFTLIILLAHVMIQYAFEIVKLW